MKQFRVNIGLPAGLVLALAAASAPAADYERGLDAFARGDVEAAYGEFATLADEGHPEAQYSLAMLYLKSDPPQYARAIPWLEASAQAALSDSQYMLGMLALYGVGMAKDTGQGMHWLELASNQGNADAKALLGELEQARLREAESERRKAELARDLQAELANAKAAEQALQDRLAKSRQREKSLATEQQSLKNARAKDAETRAKLQRDQMRLEQELVELQALLAEAERVREAQQQAAKPAPVVEQAAPAPSALYDPPGQAVVSGKVLEILPDGVLLTDVTRRIQGRDEPFPDGLVVFLNLAATEGLSQGQKVIYPAEPATPYRYKLESGATGRIRAYRVVGE
jgi:hypothetical protein